jgi:hypothetical protein
LTASSRYAQLELPLPLFERCTKCGQIIRQAPPEDPLGDAILGVLRSAQGRLVRAGLLSDFIGMRAGRTTLWERLAKFEADGLVERDAQHPRSGWRIPRRELHVERIEEKSRLVA